MKLWIAILLAFALFVALAAGVYFAPGHGSEGPQGLKSKVEWQRMGNPGELSQAHAFLDHNCDACHTPFSGIEPVNCITCHANDENVLQRQPTAFHADINSCRECHIEHQGRASRITQMDHEKLVFIGMKQLSPPSVLDEEITEIVHGIKWRIQKETLNLPSTLKNMSLSPGEHTLYCATCHQNNDQHYGLFGNDCSTCHETLRWTIPEFRHPSSASMDCAQCHQAPPSHYMMHFKMISATVAGKPNARVDQCFVCHQTTSWIDIKNVGLYKHH